MIKSTNFNLLTSISILFMGVLIGFALIATNALSANAQTNPVDNIVFPIAELGGCENKSECKSYCDDIEHINECIAFAEKHNLMNEREVRDAREFADRGIRRGPGSCTTHDECEAYCENVNNIEECLAFAEKHDILPKEELKEARQIAKALREGAELPGGCTNKQSCDTYCSDSAHIEECVAFAEKAGFMDEKELEEVRKILPLMKSGQMPGGCTSKEQCEAYCEDDANIIECVAFAEKAGFMSPEEAEMVRKTGGRGPGGCVRDECEEYCKKPENQDACFAFAKEHNLIPEEDLARMKEGTERIREGLQHAGPEVISCLKREVGPNIINEIENGTFSPSRKSGEAIKNCFEQHMERPNFPPEVEQCIKQVYGEDGIDRVMKGEIDQSEIERGIRPCINKLMKGKFEDEGGFNRGHEGDFDREHERRDEHIRGEIEEKFEEFVRDDGDPEEFKRKFDEERDRREQEFRHKFEKEEADFRPDMDHNNQDEMRKKIEEKKERTEERFERDFESHSERMLPADDFDQQKVFEEEKRKIEEQIRLETERRIKEQHGVF